MRKSGKSTKKRDRASPDFLQDPFYARLQGVFAGLQGTYSIPRSEADRVLGAQEILIPVSIFNEHLGALETITKFLRENLHHTFKEIARLLNRSEKTAWQTYHAATKKLPAPFVIAASEYVVPLSVVADRGLSVLEGIVAYLKDFYQLSYHEVAVLLHRDDRTVWTVYHRAQQKKARGGGKS